MCKLTTFTVIFAVAMLLTMLESTTVDLQMIQLPMSTTSITLMICTEVMVSVGRGCEGGRDGG